MIHDEQPNSGGGFGLSTLQTSHTYDDLTLMCVSGLCHTEKRLLGSERERKGHALCSVLVLHRAARSSQIIRRASSGLVHRTSSLLASPAETNSLTPDETSFFSSPLVFSAKNICFYQSDAIMICNKVLKKPAKTSTKTPPCCEDELAAHGGHPNNGTPTRLPLFHHQLLNVGLGTRALTQSDSGTGSCATVTAPVD